MIYIMNQGHPAPPSVGYLDTIERGYRAVGFHVRDLAEAVRRTMRRKKTGIKVKPNGTTMARKYLWHIMQ